MTPEDAERLAEIRETHDDPESDPDCDECFLLRLLDATKERANKVIVEHMDGLDRLAAALAAAEAQRAEAQQEAERWWKVLDRIADGRHLGIRGAARHLAQEALGRLEPDSLP